MVAVDLGRGASQDFMRCVNYEKTTGEVHNALYILQYYYCDHQKKYKENSAAAI